MNDAHQKLYRIGFIGLGTMGFNMAKRILSSGYPLIVFNRTPSRAQPLVAMGVPLAETPLELARVSDIVITMISDDAALDDVVFKENGILPEIREGKVFINMSTVSLDIVTKINNLVTKQHGVFIDAPVSGSKTPAEQGTLLILFGGEKEQVDRYSPLLLTMGKKILYAGKAGMGTRLKLTANLLLGDMMGALSETFNFGVANGIAPELIFDMIGSSTLSSPLYTLKSQNILKHDFTPAFPLKHQYKDLNLISELADKLHIELPLTKAADAVFATAVAEGKGDMDMSAVVTLNVKRQDIK